MNNAAVFSSIPSLELVDASPSLRDVAAYLRGVADATAALSKAPTPAVEASELPERHDTISGCGRPSRRTVPYGTENASDAPPRLTMAYPSPQDPTDVAPPFVDLVGGDVVPDSWADENGGERGSGVRLRADRLSPEWYELVETGMG
jgi:hypothetical protein